VVGVGGRPFSANSAANGNDAPGAVTLLPKTDTFIGALPSLFCRAMPALPQFVIALF
jgi:hypothetical protein